MSRKLSRSEEKVGWLTQLVTLTGWCLRKLRRYMTFAALIKVVLPDTADVMTVLDINCNLRLRACVVDV